jgi:hypothetical protein
MVAVDASGAPGLLAMTVGAAVIGRQVGVRWVDVLTASGQVTRHAPDALPADALVVAAALATIQRGPTDALRLAEGPGTAAKGSPED